MGKEANSKDFMGSGGRIAARKGPQARMAALQSANVDVGERSPAVHILRLTRWVAIMITEFVQIASGGPHAPVCPRRFQMV